MSAEEIDIDTRASDLQPVSVDEAGIKKTASYLLTDSKHSSVPTPKRTVSDLEKVDRGPSQHIGGGLEVLTNGGVISYAQRCEAEAEQGSTVGPECG
jgi:hypothetical protein